MARMTPHKRAVATVGTYTDRQGNEKKRYLNVGTLFKYEDGGLALKIDAVPIGEGWNGFISFYDIEDRQDSNRGGGERPQQRQSGPRESYDLNDDIPF